MEKILEIISNLKEKKIDPYFIITDTFPSETLSHLRIFRRRRIFFFFSQQKVFRLQVKRVKIQGLGAS